ncbi:MAG: hypothetical protein WAU86_13020, partial [Oricola sp.]
VADGEISSPYACEKIRFLVENPGVVAGMGDRSHAHFVANCFDIRSVRAHVRDILFGKSG